MNEMNRIATRWADAELVTCPDFNIRKYAKVSVVKTCQILKSHSHPLNVCMYQTTVLVVRGLADQPPLGILTPPVSTVGVRELIVLLLYVQHIKIRDALTCVHVQSMDKRLEILSPSEWAERSMRLRRIQVYGRGDISSIDLGPHSAWSRAQDNSAAFLCGCSCTL